MHGPYLVGLLLSGRRVVIVGGGVVARRRLARLIDAGADVLVVSPQVLPEVEALARSGAITWTPRPYRHGDLADAWYAMALTDVPEVNAAVCAEAEASRVACVRADDAPRGTAITTAGAQVDDVHLGVVTWGRDGQRSSRRAAALRDDLVAYLRPGGA